MRSKRAEKEPGEADQHQVKARKIKPEERRRQQHNEGSRVDLLAGRPGYPLHLVLNLSEEDARPADPARYRRNIPGAFEPCCLHELIGPFIASTSPTTGIEWPRRAGRIWQARRESNPQPPVLETGALPIELLAYAGITAPHNEVQPPP
ncbi:uncharacterized protein METZ01_LOCUS7253 [marine metagenome]|uniref:Uncharacterized protein n=1 Tax=marine metagenome TaxID=408172 RepID=A0A381NJ37_9ZZZZ